MNSRKFVGKWMVTGAATLMLGVAAATVPSGAQTPPAASDANSPAYSADYVLNKIGAAAGVTAVADSSVGTIRVHLPSAATTRQNYQQQIADIVKALPPGTIVAKLYLPVTPGKTWKGDDIAAYAAASARLFGPVGDPNQAGTVEILGQRVPASSAESYLTGLHLQPVWLVSNPQARTAAQQKTAQATYDAQVRVQERTLQQQQRDTARTMERQMTPQQRRQYRQMSPAQRQQVLQQYGRPRG